MASLARPVLPRVLLREKCKAGLAGLAGNLRVGVRIFLGERIIADARRRTHTDARTRIREKRNHTRRNETKCRSSADPIFFLTVCFVFVTRFFFFSFALSLCVWGVIPACMAQVACYLVHGASHIACLFVIRWLVARMLLAHAHALATGNPWTQPYDMISYIVVYSASERSSVFRGFVGLQ